MLGLLCVQLCIMFAPRCSRAYRTVNRRTQHTGSFLSFNVISIPMVGMRIGPKFVKFGQNTSYFIQSFYQPKSQPKFQHKHSIIKCDDTNRSKIPGTPVWNNVEENSRRQLLSVIQCNLTEIRKQRLWRCTNCHCVQGTASRRCFQMCNGFRFTCGCNWTLCSTFALFQKNEVESFERTVCAKLPL